VRCDGSRLRRQSGWIAATERGRGRVAVRSAFRRAAAGVVLAGFLGACAGTPSPVPQLATVTVTFDMGGGGAGFAATIYAQEVSTGKTFKSFYPAGSHGLVVLPTSAPVSINVEAPGTYVFYATLIEAPDDYQYGATNCRPAEPCPASILRAIDVQPGGAYSVTIADRAAPIPTQNSPVEVPWER